MKINTCQHCKKERKSIIEGDINVGTDKKPKYKYFVLCEKCFNDLSKGAVRKWLRNKEK